MTKPTQPKLFPIPAIDSASKREMLRRNGGIREVEGVRLWRKPKRKVWSGESSAGSSIEWPRLGKMR